MDAGYRAALALPGAPAFTSAAFLARLPIAITGLGIVLLVSGTTGSYAAAGASSAAYTVAAAIGSVLTSRLADRRGQRPVLATLACLNGIGMLAIVAAVSLGAPLAVVIAAAACAGCVQPAVGSMVRARWAQAAGDREHLLRAGFAVESILDEVMFTVGPLLAATASVRIGLGAPLCIAAAIVVAGGLALASLRRSEPPRHPAGHRAGSALRTPGIGTIACAAAGIGGVFGAFEVSVVAAATQAGQTGASGVILALYAAGSAAGGLWFGARRWTAPLPTQLIRLTALGTVSLVPAVLAPGLAWLGAAAVLAGAVVAPMLITGFALTERTVPRALLTEGLAAVTSALTVGFASGIALGGWLLDEHGPAAGFSLAVLAAAWAFLVAVVRHRAAVAAMREAEPGLPAVPIADDPIPGPQPGPQPGAGL